MDRNRIPHYATLLGVLCLITACMGESQPPEVAGDSAASGPDVAHVPSNPVLPQQLPPGLLVRRGACPFECCQYSEWTARTEIPVVAQERGSGTPIFVIRSGETFRADSGNVHVTEVARVAVLDSVADGDYWSFEPGDTLAVLDYIGEGHYNVYHDGKVQDVDGFWGEARQPRVAQLIGEPKTEWWVHVTTADGRRGWVSMDRGVEVGGPDSCG